jgi:hypothetical protein
MPTRANIRRAAFRLAEADIKFYSSASRRDRPLLHAGDPARYEAAHGKRYPIMPGGCHVESRDVPMR